MASSSSLTTPLSALELQQLHRFLSQFPHLDLFQTHGLLTAVLSSPIFISMQSWLVAILGQNTFIDADTDSDLERQTMTEMLLRIKMQLAEILSKQEHFIPLISFDENMASKKIGLELWCTGYLRGMFLAIDEWIPKGGRKIALYLLPIVLLSQGDGEIELQELASYFQENLAEEEFRNLKKQREEASVLLPHLIQMIYNYWHKTPTKKTPYFSFQKKLVTEED